MKTTLTMFDKLIDWLLGLWSEINPFVIVYQYEGAVHMRMGSFRKILKTGFHFLPLKSLFIDTVYKKYVTIDTFHVANINVTTTDAKTITIGAIIEYTISDVQKFILDANDAISNAHDLSRAVIADVITDCTWEEVKRKTTQTKIKNKLKSELEPLGMEIHQVKFGDVVISRGVFTIFKE